jgi:hypothetical protein
MPAAGAPAPVRSGRKPNGRLAPRLADRLLPYLPPVGYRTGWTLGCEPWWNGVRAPVARFTIMIQEPLR